MPPFGIGEGRHLRRQGIGIGDVLLELATAIFAQGDAGFEFLQRHCEIISIQLI